MYETVLEQVLEYGGDEEHQLLRLDLRGGVKNHKLALSSLIMKTTPIIASDVNDVADMSILKQSLLFNEARAAISVYKLTRMLDNIKFEDYITCLEDFELMVEKIPAQ